jgi:hypothetical protein
MIIGPNDFASAGGLTRMTMKAWLNLDWIEKILI